jgi:hypothetical protein
MNSRQQQGATLPVSLIMLVVVTLLVVYSLRAGNTNLRIAGNTQVQAEANASAQQALEQELAIVIQPATVIGSLGTSAMNISSGGVTYTAVVGPDKCIMQTLVMSDELDTGKAEDQPCVGELGKDTQFDKDGKPIPQPTECLKQLWEVKAQITGDSTNSGVSVTQVQGISVRVPSKDSCL